jgi:hypothetical protein
MSLQAWHCRFKADELDLDRRVSFTIPARRNEFVSTLADQVWFAPFARSGKKQRLAHRIAARE